MLNRLEKIRQKLTEESLDALLVSQAENRRYLSGFTGSAGHLLISRDQAILATDFRYIEQGGMQAPEWQVFRLEGDLSPSFAPILSQLGAKRVGFEANHVSYASHQALAQAASQVPAELVPTQGWVEGLRAVKDPQELERLRQAIALADRAFAQVAQELEPGMTEREAAWRIERYIRKHGGEGVSFETIVAAGPHGALPHWRPSDTPIQAGQPVVLDLGARYQGYCSDLTRTLCLGEPDDTFKRVYAITHRAQRAAKEAMRCGMTGEEADALARQVIAEAGYGEQFGHALGHGVGLAVHEMPRLGKGSLDRLQEGMVFTVEPGIYLSGWGGVRLEDMVVLADGGATVLTRAPKLPWG